MREGVARWGERHPASIAPERQLACPTTLWPIRYVMGKAVIVSTELESAPGRTRTSDTRFRKGLLLSVAAALRSQLRVRYVLTWP
jgi:hypothetical protein